jgi:hypothetical protein
MRRSSLRALSLIFFVLSLGLTPAAFAGKRHPASAAGKSAPTASSGPHAYTTGSDGGYFTGHTRPEIGFGGPFAIVGGHIGFGFTGQLLFPLSGVPGLWIGPETGFYHWSTGASAAVNGVTVVDVSGSTNTFPILGAAIFHLPPNAQFWHGANVYVGGAMGFAVSSSSASSAGYSVSTSSTDFCFLLRPGISFGGDNGHMFYAEPVIGSIANLFIFAPTFGVSFPL